MLYKTIALELLEQHRELADQLRKKRLLLAAVERCARELKTSHEAWKKQLTQARPGSQSQIASEALEIAVKDLEDCLRTASPLNGTETLSLDEAMAFLRLRTPPA